MNILVTGASGQLGNEIRLLSINSSHRFVFTDKDSLDITQEKEIISFFEDMQPDVCINTAAYTAVDKAESHLESCFLTNTKAPELLAKACKKYKTKFIHISTDFVFDGESNVPYTESSAVNPINVYGKTKQEGEQRVLTENAESIIVRTSWLYSSFGNNFVKTMIRYAKERREVNVVFDQIGTPTYAKDLAEVLLKIIEKKDSLKGIYHFSNEGVCSWYDFAHAIFEIHKLKVSLSPIRTAQYPTEAKRPPYSVLDKTKIKNALQISIRHWRDALNECIKILVGE
ncbi:MAG: dTDP-4-dehydrorhamnose reductase [Cytophagales bacterium]|nr:dTDP-4-dehydrorhamnose reductase [Cytophagales bacterium]MDW8385354.1 dTDP-4-dehydrorhamnose reductase [Flammeovirgaceae bacterium]